MTKLEEKGKEEERKARASKKKKRRRSGSLGVDQGTLGWISTLEVRILCLFKFIFYVDLRNVMLKLGFFLGFC